MNLKIIGVGKCGSRVCYDFFAFVRGLPTAYEIRVKEKRKGLGKVIDSAADLLSFNSFLIGFRRHWQELTQAEILKGTAEYILIDSDLENNELRWVVSKITKEGKNEERYVVFPGAIYPLNGFTGGCQFHVVSENVTNGWNDEEVKQQAKEFPAQRGFDIIAYAFSVGGGTGGGAAPLLADKFRRINRSDFGEREIHQLCLAILPQSDQTIFTNEPGPAMDVNEKYNSGRFFCGLYGKRHLSGGEPYLNSLWLVSNDLLRTIARTNERFRDDVETLNNRALSLVNHYLAAALSTLCNASSPATHSAGNFDAKELNGILDGSPFISGFAIARPEGVVGDTQDATYLQMLFRMALGNTTLDGDATQGLSVPVEDESLRPLMKVFDKDTRYASMKDFVDAVDSFDLNALPLEFRTARKVAMIYGQTDARPSFARVQGAESILAKVFKNSECRWSHFRHSGNVEYLLILISDPFIPAVAAAVLDYASRAWLQDSSIDLQSVIEAETFESARLRKDSPDNEFLEEQTLGKATLDRVKTFEPLLPFQREHFVSGIEALHKMYHHKRRVAQTWSKR